MPQNHIKKAMVLCAGLGTRLLPITEVTPKPVVSVLNLPNVLYTFFLLERAGVEEIIVNSHHLAEKLESFLSVHPKLKSKVSFSREKILLGTGGGVKKAEKFFNGEPFFLANCDFISNVDLAEMADRHFAKNSLATMVLIQDPEREKLYSKVGVDANGNLCSLPRLQTKEPVKTGIFTGIHILSPECLSYLEEKPSGINEILYPSLMKEKPTSVHGVFATGSYWYDTGDMPAFWQTSLELLKNIKNTPVLETLKLYNGEYQEVETGVWLLKNQELPSSVECLGPVMIGKNCKFGKSVKIGPNTVIGDGVQIEDGCEIENSVVLSYALVKKNSTVSSSVWFGQKNLTVPGK